MAALDGIDVLDFSQLIAGPCATTMLGQLGAQVIKVEPEAGELGRTLGSAPAGGESPTFRVYNRYKQLVSADLKQDAGIEAVVRLASQCDVIVQNFRPGVMEAFGLDYESVKAINPSVIYCSLSGFPRNGAHGSRRGVDIVLQAESGILDMTGFPGETPSKVGFTVVDAAAAHVIVHSVLAGLFARERTGAGTNIELSLYDVAVHLQAAPIAQYLDMGERPGRQGNSAPLNAPADVFPTADGYLAVSAYSKRHWTALCEALDRADLVVDERYGTIPDRVANRESLWAALAERFATQTSSDWVRDLVPLGIAVGAVRPLADVADDELHRPDPVVFGVGDELAVRIPYLATGDLVRSDLDGRVSFEVGADAGVLEHGFTD